MFGSSSTTSSRASACAPGSMIDVFMIYIFARFAEENLNVSSGTAVASSAYAAHSPGEARALAGPRRQPAASTPARGFYAAMSAPHAPHAPVTPQAPLRPAP